MDRNYADKIRALLGDGQGHALKMREMAGKLGVRKNAYTSFRSVVKRMHREALLIKTRGGRYCLPDGQSDGEGVLRALSERFGFVILADGSPDVFVASRDQGGALDGDRVRVRLRRTGGHKKSEGMIVEVLERGRKTLVGTLQHTRYGMTVRPDSRSIHLPIHITAGGDMKARDGEKVVVGITEWQPAALYGTVTKVLGLPGDPGLDLLQVMYEFDLPFEFPSDVLAEAAAIPDGIDADEIAQRTDMRTKIVCTIDPETAADFDDALSLETDAEGNEVLGIHIADVGYYVHAGSPLDKEALLRGNSTYLPGRTVPMLPERLSSELCSLRPDVERLTLSVFCTMDDDGGVQSYRIERSIIKSSLRLTYARAQELLTIEQADTPLEQDVAKVLKRLDRLKNILLERRMREGGVDLELPETSFRFDSEGRVTDILAAQRMDSHRLVEECMLLANKVVAEHLEKKGGEALYRVHDKPDAEELERFFGLMTKMDLWKAGRGKVDPEYGMRAFLKKYQGTSMRFAHELLLRSMKRALYATTNIGHYGLGFDAYTHFTSPIRRYADLVIHRLLVASLAVHTGTSLLAVARLVTDTEKKSSDAERKATKIKHAEYMGKRLGEEFEGYIAGVQSFGMFICLNDILVEGLVHVRDMDGYYEYDAQALALTAHSSGRRFRIGERVRVQLVRTNADRGEIDFHLIKKLKVQR